MLRNIRYALRVLARTPAFTVTIVATLAIVIGANATVFSLIDAVLLKPLPFPDADRLVLLSEHRHCGRRASSRCVSFARSRGARFSRE